MSAPASARAMATDWPMPRVPPVTTAVWPSREKREAIVWLRIETEECLKLECELDDGGVESRFQCPAVSGNDDVGNGTQRDLHWPNQVPMRQPSAKVIVSDSV